MGFDTETVMGNQATESLRNTLGNCPTEVFTEFSYGAGQTDVVIANISNTYLQRRINELNLGRPIDPAYLQAFVILHRREQITRTYFEQLYSGKRSTDAVLRWLHDHGFIKRTDDGKIRTTPNLRRHVTTSYAVELKLSKWQQALKQAYRAKSYADYQYIALDASHVEPGLENREQFEKYGVGIISIEESGECTVHYRPERTGPSTPLTVWKLNEQTLNGPTFNHAAD